MSDTTEVLSGARAERTSTYRSKHDAARTLAAFGARMRAEVDLGALTSELTAVVEQTMQPGYVSVWLRPSNPRSIGPQIGEP